MELRITAAHDSNADAGVIAMALGPGAAPVDSPLPSTAAPGADVWTGRGPGDDDDEDDDAGGGGNGGNIDPDDEGDDLDDDDDDDEEPLRC